MSENKKVVIIGAGFGGIALCNALRGKPFDVLLIDKNNFHTFQPLLYQVATGGLEATSIAYPVRRILRGFRNVRFRMAEVFKVDQSLSTIETSVGQFPFDYLVIASGSTNNFFNFTPIQDRFLPLKSINDALNLRSFVMQNLEKAISEKDKSEKNELMNIAIVGGGPAGIELAGALTEMKRYVLPKDFPEIDFETMSISLFEAAPKLISAMSEEASRHAFQYLEKMGVNVRLNSQVKDYDNHHVFLSDGTAFQTDTVIWTAGVKGNPINDTETSWLVSGNRIGVNEFNQVPTTATIFAIGDVAAHVSEETPKGLPMLAPVAQMQARHLAKNLILRENGKSMLPFSYKNKGVMATVGRNRAVADFPSRSFHGTFAWFLWMFVHIMSLVGFRNRLITLIDWMTNYFNYDRPLGLIIRAYHKDDDIEKNDMEKSS